MAAPVGDFQSAKKQGALTGAAQVSQLSLPRFPRLPGWVLSHDLGDDRLQLASPTLFHTISHPLFVKIFKAISHLLDGKHEIVDLLEAASKLAEPTTTLFFLKSLYANGIIYEGDTSSLPVETQRRSNNRQMDFFANYLANPASAISNMCQAQIATLSSPHLYSLLEASLRSIGIERIERLSTENLADELADLAGTQDGGPPLLLIAAFEHRQRRDFANVNKLCLDYGIRWLHVNGSAAGVTVGPTIVPHQTACYGCYQNRLSSHLPYRLNPEGSDELLLGQIDAGDDGWTGPLWGLAFAHIAMECARLMTGYASPTTIGRCHEINGAGVTVSSHDVLKLPRCQLCGVGYSIGEEDTDARYAPR